MAYWLVLNGFKFLCDVCQDGIEVLALSCPGSFQASCNTMDKWKGPALVPMRAGVSQNRLRKTAHPGVMTGEQQREIAANE